MTTKLLFLTQILIYSLIKYFWYINLNRLGPFHNVDYLSGMSIISTLQWTYMLFSRMVSLLRKTLANINLICELGMKMLCIKDCHDKYWKRPQRKLFLIISLSEQANKCLAQILQSGGTHSCSWLRIMCNEMIYKLFAIFKSVTGQKKTLYHDCCHEFFVQSCLCIILHTHLLLSAVITPD